MQKSRLMSRAVKFLTRAFSMQAQKNTNKKVTHILTAQLSLSLRFQKHMREQACPCILLSLLSWLGRFPSKTKANNFAATWEMRVGEPASYSALLWNSSPRASPRATDIASLWHTCRLTEVQMKHGFHILSRHYSVSLEVSGEFLKYTQHPPKLCVQVPPREWRRIQIYPKQKLPKVLVLVWAGGKGKVLILGQPKLT